ncbi:MAG TPA: uridylate kinase [Methanocorpusculum sp.]|nr:uridylate kinase [Methanocorpusculum sp.]
MRKGVVVKVGGSLMDTASEVIRILATSPVPVLIVPGGGIFANGVRYLGIDGTAAHWMAVAAMDQYGWFLSTFGVSAVDECLMPTVGVKIFLPYRFLRDVDPLPHSWDVTSDTISAWIAGQLECPLLLLKSVDGVLLEDELLAEVPEGMIPDVIDPCCLDILRKFAVSAKIINGRCLTRISDYLRGFEVLGTQLP